MPGFRDPLRRPSWVLFGVSDPSTREASLRHSNILGFRAPLRRPSWSRRAKQRLRLKNRFQVTPESFLGPGSAVSGHFPGEAKDPGGSS